MKNCPLEEETLQNKDKDAFNKRKNKCTKTTSSLDIPHSSPANTSRAPNTKTAGNQIQMMRKMTGLGRPRTTPRHIQPEAMADWNGSRMAVLNGEPQCLHHCRSGKLGKRQNGQRQASSPEATSGSGSSGSGSMMVGGCTARAFSAVSGNSLWPHSRQKVTESSFSRPQ